MKTTDDFRYAKEAIMCYHPNRHFSLSAKKELGMEHKEYTVESMKNISYIYSMPKGTSGAEAT